MKKNKRRTLYIYVVYTLYIYFLGPFVQTTFDSLTSEHTIFDHMTPFRAIEIRPGLCMRSTKSVMRLDCKHSRIQL